MPIGVACFRDRDAITFREEKTVNIQVISDAFRKEKRSR
jgi:hypothetical protein